MKYLLVSFCVLFFSCQDPLPDKKALIKQYYSEKVNKLKVDKLKQCREDILVEVEMKIDSLIDNFINADLLDTLRFPVKPVKPNHPDHIIDKVKKFDLDTVTGQAR